MWQAVLAEATHRREMRAAAARATHVAEPPAKTVGFAGLARMMSKGR